MSQAGTAKKNLMLGNGFSVALFPKIFNYKTLAENIESERINSLFDAIDTHDFEFVMRRLWEIAGSDLESSGNLRVRSGVLKIG